MTEKTPTADCVFDALVDEELTTVRLTFGLVSASSCRTARRIGALLQRRGWTGSVGTCRRCADEAPRP